ncbi:GSCOCG00005896001-RA-CDS, partial [Cotesia congregata]
MYFYASKLTAAALSAGLRGGGGGGGGGHSTNTGAVCRCHETPGNDSTGNKGINAAPAELRSPGPSLRQLGKFSPPPLSKSTHRAPQQNYGITNTGFGPTTSEHVFVTANIEHRSNHHHQHHRHRSKHK